MANGNGSTSDEGIGAVIVRAIFFIVIALWLLNSAGCLDFSNRPAPEDIDWSGVDLKGADPGEYPYGLSEKDLQEIEDYEHGTDAEYGSGPYTWYGN